MNIKRFNPAPQGYMDEYRDGKWISYTDHIAALEAVKERDEPLSWITDATIKLTNAIGGGSELFVKHGDGFRADIAFICARIRETRENSHKSLSREIRARRAAETALEANRQVIETLRAALELSREWIGILRGSCGDVSMQMGDDRDPSVLEEAVYSKIAAALSAPTQGEVK